MATKNYANSGNQNNQSETENSQNLDILIDLLSEINQTEQNSTLNANQDQKYLENTSFKPSNQSHFVNTPLTRKEDWPLYCNDAPKYIDEKKYINPSSTPKENFNYLRQQDISSNNRATVRHNINDLQQSIKKLEKKLGDNREQLDEVMDSVNSLLSLTVELIHLQPNTSPKAIIELIVPVIDRIIEQRSTQDLPKMAAALANILPVAITKKIEATPQSIAQALAPEIALSIQEQIRLDKDSISTTIGPEMGKAIKAQIQLERDAMVDALYPVIGSTISKYMVEVVSTINEKIENALSIEGIKRKISARLQGVSEAELILKEAIPYKVQAIFLIHKASGLVIRELQPDLTHQLESDLVAGMLTAIRSFANDLIAESSELDEIDYGDCKIILEVAGYCYLAVVVKGEPSKKLRQKIRNTLSKLVLKYGNTLEAYNGDSSTVPESINLFLEQLLENETNQHSSKRPTTLIWLTMIVLSAIIIPWSIATYKSKVANRIRQQIAVELDSVPELSVYRLIPEVDGNKIILTGRVPSEYLRKQAEQTTAKIVNQSKLTLDNQIIAVDVPPDPTITKGEVARLTSVLNQQEGVAILSKYQDYTATIEGFVLNQPDQSVITQGFRQIPGVDKIIISLEKQLPVIDTKIYFASNSTELNPADFSIKIKQTRELLALYPQLHLQIIGYSDRSGFKEQNETLAKRRANTVKAALVSQGVRPQRLQVVASTKLPFGVTESQPLWQSRCVEFKFFILNNSKNAQNN